MRRAVLARFGRTPHVPEVGEGFWHRLATSVMRRPLPIAAAIIAILLVLGAPFIGVHFGQPDARVLPRRRPPAQRPTPSSRDFSSGEANAFSVVAPTGTGRGRDDRLRRSRSPGCPASAGSTP